MFCYRDMTFCTAKDCVKFDDDLCYRALTNQRINMAQTWWKDCVHGEGDVPICLFTEPPECYERKK